MCDLDALRDAAKAEAAADVRAAAGGRRFGSDAMTFRCSDCPHRLVSVVELILHLEAHGTDAARAHGWRVLLACLRYRVKLLEVVARGVDGG